jgi:hypothetical protein
MSSVPAEAQPLPEYLREVFAAARQATPPLCAARFRAPSLRLLTSLCRELQRDAEASNNDRFFLSGHVAAEFLGVPPATTSRFLGRIEHAGVIVCVNRGKPIPGTPASEYRFIGAD